MKRPKTVLSSALRHEFRKDLELFKHFLLLLNNSGTIRNVELMWNEELDPMKSKNKDRLGTADALVQLQPASANLSNRISPGTEFCDLVHGFGDHEEETCAKSDVPAKHRCQLTGCTQVYSCHVGLTDIAVPVICDDEYLGTLFAGQVLTMPPSAENFRQVRKALAAAKHIDFADLETAYFRVPVVSQSQLAEMVRVLELFARYIANSWKRLQIMGEHQRNRDRQLEFDRKELATILLSGEIGEHSELDQLVHRTGLECLPDRVLVLQIQAASEEARPKIARQMTLNRLSHAAEDFCHGRPGTLAIVIRPGELCIFTRQDMRTNAHQRFTLQELAESILSATHTHEGARARVGISAAHSRPADLAIAYQEACAALNADDSAISFFAEPAAKTGDAVQCLEKLLKAIQGNNHVHSAVREFLVRAMPSGNSSTRIQQLRAFLTWAVEHLALEMVSIGGDEAAVSNFKQQAIAGVLNAPTPFSACESFRKYSENLASHVSSIYVEREKKIVQAVTNLVDEREASHVTIHDLAEALHLSSGHLSRVFRRTTGLTLEEFLIRQRVELAKRKLLDPRLNIAEVAERCGFCNPAYFASVFKKYVRCTPREFARRPHLWTTGVNPDDHATQSSSYA
jgi:AraC-like DNA-binding protein/ligand-binding sensor protein